MKLAVGTRVKLNRGFSSHYLINQDRGVVVEGSGSDCYTTRVTFTRTGATHYVTITNLDILPPGDPNLCRGAQEL